MPPNDNDRLDQVDYDRKAGALCPDCQRKMPVTNTLAWEGDARIRYHQCVCGKRCSSTESAQVKKIVNVSSSPENKGFRSNPYHPLAR